MLIHTHKFVKQMGHRSFHGPMAKGNGILIRTCVVMMTYLNWNSGDSRYLVPVHSWKITHKDAGFSCGGKILH